VPTVSLGRPRKTGAGLEFSLGDERILFPSLLAPSELEQLLRAHRETLRAAEERGDASAETLDPFSLEREGWAEAPAPQPERGRVAMLRRAAPGVFRALSLAVPLTLSASWSIDQAGDSWGIMQARRQHGEWMLWGFLTHGGRSSRPGSEASALLFRMIEATPDEKRLKRFIDLDVEPHEQAQDELFSLALQTRPPWLYEFVRTGAGPRRDRIDAFLLREATDKKTAEALEFYATYGSRGDEVRRVQLPRLRLDLAIKRTDIQELRALAQGPEETRQEATAELERLYAGAQKNLERATGLQTPLARFVHEELGHGPSGSIGIRLEPGAAEPGQAAPPPFPHQKPGLGVPGALKQVLDLYLDGHLLPVSSAWYPASQTRPQREAKIQIFQAKRGAPGPGNRPGSIEVSLRFITPEGALIEEQKILIEDAPEVDRKEGSPPRNNPIDVALRQAIKGAAQEPPEVRILRARARGRARSPSP